MSMVINPYIVQPSTSNLTLSEIISDLGVGTNLQLALDAGDSASVKDQYFSSNSLLLHCDGADASTTFTDSATGKTVTAVGNAQIDTAQKKFGTASALFDGTGDCLSVPDSSGWNLGTGNFTIEAHIRPNSLAAAGSICGQRADNDNRLDWRVLTTGELFFVVVSAGVALASYSSTNAALTTGTWYHLAVVRNGASLAIYKDRTALTLTESTEIASNSLPDLAAALAIGAGIADASVTPFNGWIDEFRWTKGVARYTANSTALTEAHPDGKWHDTSGNGNDFFRGADGIIGTDHPTFNGTAGALSSSEYWSFDGGDFFTYDTTNEAWMQNLHKNNAAFTIAFWLRPAGSAPNWVFGTNNNDTSNIGVSTGVNTSNGESLLNICNGTGTLALGFPLVIAAVDSAWQFFAVSADEAAASGFWMQDGIIYGPSSFSYSSPSAANSTYTAQIAAHGNAGGGVLPNTARLGMFMAWSRALSQTELKNLNAATRSRFF